MVDLQLQEVAYQAALASTARVLQPSLVDFLR
jgi:flagellar hook-associated protein 3 FlgL